MNSVVCVLCAARAARIYIDALRSSPRFESVGRLQPFSNLQDIVSAPSYFGDFISMLLLV